MTEEGRTVSLLTQLCVSLARPSRPKIDEEGNRGLKHQRELFDRYLE